MARKPPLAGYLAKEPSPTHEAVAEWVTKQTGHAVTSGDVALIQRLYPLYLKSPAVVKTREAEAAAKAAAEKEKADRKAAVLRERLAKAEQAAAKLRRELGIDTDDETAPPVLSVVPATVDTEDDDVPTEPVVVTLGGDEADEFVETTPDPDEDDWGDDTDDGEEDF